MAATRPAVLVFQEFASLSTSPATPDLNCLVAGPCYWIKDFPDERDEIQAAGAYGTKETANPYAAPVGGSDALVVAEPPGNKAGAVLDTTSARVFLNKVRVEITKGGDDALSASGTTAADTATLTVGAGSFITAGVLAGDKVILTDAEVAPTTIVRTVRTVTALTLTFTDDTPAAGFVAGATTLFRVERELTDREVDSSFVTVAGQAITLKGGVTLSVGGTLKTVNYAEEVFIAYRSLRADLALVTNVNSTSEVATKLGKLDARNPLAVGVTTALLNTVSGIQAYGVATDDATGYGGLKTAISSRKDVYAVVPLTDDVSIVSSFKTDFESLADPDFAQTNGVPQKFRVCIAAPTALPTQKTLIATATATAATAGGVLTLTVSSVPLVDSGVIVGDKVKIGAVEYEILSVDSNQRLTATNTGDAVDGAITFAALRDLDKAGQVEALQAVATSIASRRIVLCWPDSVVVSGLKDGSLARTVASVPEEAGAQPGYYLAAAVGGLTAALPSHQGFTNLGIAGIETINNSTGYFSDQQMSAISNSGWFVFAQDSEVSLPYCIHQLTTDPSALEFGEFSMVKNFDFVSLFFSDVLDDFIGTWNINDETRGFVRAALESGIDSLKLRRRAKIGAPIKGATVTSLTESTVSSDRLEIFVEVDFPAPLNTVALHLVSI